MKKFLRMLLLTQVSLLCALTPPAVPGENLWDLTARIGQELDIEIEAENSLFDMIDSKVDGVHSDADLVASCCDNVNAVLLPSLTSKIDIINSAIETASSLVDEIDAVDLVRIESKVDNLANAVEQSLSDEFATISTLTQIIASTTDSIDGLAESWGSKLDSAVSSIDEIKHTEFDYLNSQIDGVDSITDVTISCYEQLATIDLPRLESKIDVLDFASDASASLVEAALGSVSDIFTQLENINSETSIIESVAETVESTMEVVASKIDALGGGSVGASCAATPITQADITAAGGTLTIGVTVGFTAPGNYCLAEDVIGAIVIASNDVTLNLNNHLINSSGATAIAATSFSRLVIQNGRINGAIVLDLCKEVVIEDMQVYGAAICISIATSQVVTVQHCQIRSSTAIAIDIESSSSSIVVSDVSIDTATGQGIIIGSGSKNIALQGCSLRSLNGDGIRVGGGASNVSISECGVNICYNGISISGTGIDRIEIKDCSLERNNASGISVGGSSITGITIQNNNVSGNGLVAAVAGIDLDACTGVYVGYNVVNNTQSGAGIKVSNSSDGVIEYNVAMSNGGAGIDVTTSVAHYSIEHNDMVGNGGVNLAFSVATDKVIVANKAFNAATSDGTGTNYSTQNNIPVLQWSRTAGFTYVNQTPATAWHNWSSVA